MVVIRYYYVMILEIIEVFKYFYNAPFFTGKVKGSKLVVKGSNRGDPRFYNCFIDTKLSLVI